MRAPLPLPSLRPGGVPLLLAGGAAFAALVIGALVARSPALGAAAAAAAVFGPLALVDLPLAFAIFAATLFLRLVPGVGLGSNVLALVVLAVFAGTAASRTSAIRTALSQMRGVLIALVLFLLWLAMTLAWAEETDRVLTSLAYWTPSTLLLILGGSALGTERAVRVVALGFAISAVAAVLYGVFSGELTQARSAFESASDDARFSGVGDPNELAAGLVPAIALLVALLPGMRRGPLQLLVIPAIGLLLVGLAATQSRGGLVAVGVCIAVTLVVARRRRLAALAITLGVVAVGAFALATTPGAIERVTSADQGGNGRSDLWTVAGRMFADKPVNGVGLNQFRVESPDYVRQPGSLEAVELIVEQPKLVHNTYLQLLAETGVIGLALFLVLVGLCVGAAVRAARVFDRIGRPSLAALAQGVVVAQAGMLAAMFFLSIGDDLRLWLLLGLGPALAAVARGASPGGLPLRSAR
jgi:O-antigen ligase